MTEGNKKMVNIWILDILRRHSSESRPLTQQDIIDYLQEEHGLELRRAAVSGYLHEFMDEKFTEQFGCRVSQGKRGSGYYLEQELNDEELRLLIDSVLSMRILPQNKADKLIKKLIKLGTPSFQKKAGNYVSFDLPRLPHSLNENVMENIAVINKAIINGHQVSFNYNDYYLGDNNEVVFRPRRKGRYTVNPYRLAMQGGRLYLVGNTEPHDNISYYRADKICRAEEMAEPAKPWREIDKNYDPPRQIAESLFMFYGDRANIKFWVNEICIRDLVDWFGLGYFKILAHDAKAGRVLVSVKCSIRAMCFWAMAYGEFAEIVEPEDLRDSLHKVIEDMRARYGQKRD